MSKKEQNEIKQLPIDQIVHFSNHAFILYKDEQLERLRLSIEMNGIIHPLIVRPIKDEDGTDKFEIISGHNRFEAAKLIPDLNTVPATVRELSDDDAAILSNEANIEQRTFKNFLPSEKAKSIHQYHSTISKPGFRSDILKPTDATSGQVGQKWDARKATADVYGVGTGIIKRYLELRDLIEPLMNRLDNDALKKDKDILRITPARNLSFIPKEIQLLIEEVLSESRENAIDVTIKKSEVLKDEFQRKSEESGKMSAKTKMTAADKKDATDKIREILTQTDDTIEETSDKTVKIPIPAEKYAELFPDDPEPEQEVVEYTITAIQQRRDNDANAQKGVG
jgi:ParB family chromosome partitioning protein